MEILDKVDLYLESTKDSWWFKPRFGIIHVAVAGLFVDLLGRVW